MIEFQRFAVGFGVVVVVAAVIRVGVGAVQFFFRVIKQINFGSSVIAGFMIGVGGWRFHFEHQNTTSRS